VKLQKIGKKGLGSNGVDNNSFVDDILSVKLSIPIKKSINGNKLYK
jgi:hypothetical protein